MNSFGQYFRLTTYGESHGLAVGGIIDGCPADVPIDVSLVQADLARRAPLGKADCTARNEADHVEWLSGLFEGRTLGTPIAFAIRNSDARSGDYEPLRHLFRPGHGDYAYYAKYHHRDWRGGGRSSGRETAARVVAGAVAKQLPCLRSVVIHAVAEPPLPQGVNQGGVVACTINGLPAGVGEPVFDRLNARLAAAMMSIPSAVGFEMGSGFAAARMSGLDYADAWNPAAVGDDRQPLCLTNHCGGVQGGISNGMPLFFRTAFHPVVTPVGQPVHCRNEQGAVVALSLSGRHDLCHVHRLPVVVESMAALTLADLLLADAAPKCHSY